MAEKLFAIYAKKAGIYMAGEPVVKKTWKTEINKCARCGKCRSVCPVFMETGSESMVARGRISLAEAVRDNVVAYSEQLRGYLLSCKKCLRCSHICPSGVDYDLIIQGVLDETARRIGIWFIPRIIFRIFLTRRWLFDVLLKVASIFQVLVPLKRQGIMRHLPMVFMGGRWIPPLARKTVLNKYSIAKRTNHPETSMRVGFFVGCLINYVYTDIADAVVDVLRHMGVQVIIPPDQLCCGTPAMSLGDAKTALRLAEHNVQVFEDAQVDAVVNACATCGRTLKNDYPKLLGGRLPAMRYKFYDISEFIETYFPAEIALINKTNARVTYHDPCHLYWGQYISQQPRKILSHLTEFHEMENPERCCGGGGVFNLLHYELSMKIGDHKFRAIEKSGADIVVTGCPGCQLQIDDILARKGSMVKSIHTIQVLREAIYSSEK